MDKGIVEAVALVVLHVENLLGVALLAVLGVVDTVTLPFRAFVALFI